MTVASASRTGRRFSIEVAAAGLTAAGRPGPIVTEGDLKALPEAARGGGLPVHGRDLFVGGRGRMVIRPLDLFTAVDARGAPRDFETTDRFVNDLRAWPATGASPVEHADGRLPASGRPGHPHERPRRLASHRR